MNYRHLVLLGATLLVSLLTYSCKSKGAMVTAADDQPQFYLSKGVCFGRCPVYEVTVYPDRKVEYYGKMNTTLLGKYTKRLDKETYQKLVKTFQALPYNSYPEQFESELVDLPLITIGYHDGKQYRTVSGKENLPNELQQAQFAIERVVDAEGWTLVESMEEIASSEAPASVTIWDEIIIKPMPGTLLPKWMKAYEQYGMHLVKKVAPNMDLFLISFDSRTIKPKELLALLKKDPSIDSAQFNKKVGRR